MRKLAVLLAADLIAGVAAPAVGGEPSIQPPFARAMKVERVEPHVLRVLDDGAGHDLTDPETFEDLKPASLLAAGDDGSMWMTSSGGFIEIGTPGEVPDPLDTFLAQMEIGPDGTLWVADGYRGTSIGRWRDGTWTFHDLPANAWVVWLDAMPDGGLELAWRDETTLYFEALPSSYGGRTATPPPPLPLISPDGSILVERTPNGHLWVAEAPWWQEEQRFGSGPLWTFDGSRWRPIEPLGDLTVRPSTLAVEESGALRVSWSEVVSGTTKTGPVHQTRHEEDGDWTVVEEPADGVTGWCEGYTWWDGQKLTRYLDGTCLRPAAITSTGDIWVFGHDRDRQNPGVYVISPGR